MITCIVQARMGSERLPGKVMKVVHNKPLIAHTLDRLGKSRYIDKVVLATSDKDTENPMVEYLTDKGYNVFRGDENNVLDRYVKAARQYGGDIIIRATGDCPLIDSVIVDEVITYFLSNDYDYVRLDVPDTFIRGFDVEIFTREAMMRVYETTKTIEGDSPYKEHVTYYIYTHQQEYKVGYVKGSSLYSKNYRLCVDTAEDLELVTKIYDHFQNDFVTAKEVVTYLDEHPEIAGINMEIQQKKV